MEMFYNLYGIDSNGKRRVYRTDYLDRFQKKLSAWKSHGWKVEYIIQNGEHS